MNKQDELDKILSWKQRKGKISHLDIIYKVRELSKLWEASRNNLEEVSDFFVMRLVTFIEVFFRDMVREIVDRGPPYIDRAEKLAKGTRIDFLFALSLHGRTISIGDIVAHSLPANRIEQIVSALNELIPDYRKKLGDAHDRWAEEIEGEAPHPIISNTEKMFADLNELLEVRHIVTHETR